MIPHTLAPNSLPTAPLYVIEYARLNSENRIIATAEGDKLYNAARTHGAFYLDLESNTSAGTCLENDTWAEVKLESEGQAYLKIIEETFGTMKDFFGLPLDEKEQYKVENYDIKVNGDYFGYKGEGASTIDDRGTRDCTEYYNIPKDDMLDQYSGQLQHPQAILNRKVILQSYMRESAKIVNCILQHISDRLGVHDPKNSLPNLHRMEVGSTSRTSMVYYPARGERSALPPLAPHTDFGTLTLLFSSSKGIQTPVPQTAIDDCDRSAASMAKLPWHWIAPQTGQAVVFCGDVIQMLTGGVVRANFHRVASQAEREGTGDRYSLGYFARPHNDVVIAPLLAENVPTDSSDARHMTVSEIVMDRAFRRRATGK